MKSIALVVFTLAVCLAFQATAQQPPVKGGKDDPKTTTPDDVKTGKTKGILPAGWKKLSLSPEQLTKVYKIQADYRVKIKDLETKIKDLKDEEHKNMTAVLTDMQKTELAKTLGLDVPKTDDKKGDDKK